MPSFSLPAPSSGKRRLLQAAVIVAAVLWIFWPALRGDWLWDDDWYVTNNSLMHDPARLWKAWFVPGSFVEYYPLEESVQWAQWQLWHNDTLGYHLTNVVLHMASALLVWRLFHKLGLRLAWLGGLLFALHPAQVESVAWISELKNALSLPPFLLAMCTWIDYEERGRRRDYLLALGFFLIAMLCKISMAAFPAVILLYAWWKRGRIDWGDLKGSLPFFAISLVLGWTTVLAGTWYLPLKNANGLVVLGGLPSRLALAGSSLAFYFSMCLWPVNLIPVYPKWTVDPPSPAQFLPWLVLGALLGWCWTNRTGWGRHVVLGLGFFLVTLAPFLGFIAVSYMYFTWVMDHFLYIPIIGLIGLAVAGLGDLGGRLPSPARSFGLGLVAAAMGFLAWESHRQAGHFVSQEALWSHTLVHNPDASPAHNNLGMALCQTGRTEEAIGHFEQAIRLNPHYGVFHYNLGAALDDLNRRTEAIGHYQEALRLNSNLAAAHNNLGSDYGRLGRTEEAIREFEAALKINPDNGNARDNLGTALDRQGRTAEAIEQFEQALRINPYDTRAQNQLKRLQQPSTPFPSP